MEDSNKQEEILGYELDEQMDVLLREVEKIVFQPQVITGDPRRDLENLVSLVRQEFENGAITQAMLDERKPQPLEKYHESYIPKHPEAYIAAAGREALGALEDKVNDPDCKRSNAEIDAVIEEQKQKYTVIRGYARTDTYEVEATNKEEADNIVDFSDDLLPIHIEYDWDHNRCNVAEGWLSDQAGFTWEKVDTECVVPNESSSDRKRLKEHEERHAIGKELFGIREELGALEDRVTDMETRMLGASLSPRDWEEEG